jgi:hypothetical protein
MFQPSLGFQQSVRLDALLLEEIERIPLMFGATELATVTASTSIVRRSLFLSRQTLVELRSESLPPSAWLLAEPIAL